VDPIAFQIGSFQIYWYGVFTALGFMAAFWTAGRRAMKIGVSPESIMNLAPFIIGGAVVGARLLYVFTYWDKEFADKPLTEIFMLRRSGLVYYGGLIGASLATIFYCRYQKLALWRIADITAPSIALGHAFGRIGCLMTGCCYGKDTNVPWAICFPHDHWTEGHPVHPTQIYESAANFAFYAGLAWVFKNRRFEGQVFALYLIGYAILRSTIEGFRGDYTPREMFAGLTPGQLVSIGTATTGVILWFWHSHRAPLKPSGAAPA